MAEIQAGGKEALNDPLLPRGDIIIGTIDPRTLPPHQFSSSPEILYHGAIDSFNFLTDFDYRGFTNPGSHTIGVGFYATPNRANAALYSEIRQQEKVPSHVFVSEVLPYQARMLDMRSQGNEMVNAPVPADFFKEWQRFCENNVRVVFPGYTNDDINADIGFINATFGVKDEVIAKERIERVRRLSYYGDLNRHLSTLRGLAASEKPIDLRSMLSISGHEDVSEFAAFIFSDFMRSKGYDGLIYNEGGERSDQNHTLSYVFYNLQTIGTYDSWHQDDK